jgi:hypothetical protein
VEENALVFPSRDTDLFSIKNKPFLFIAENQQLFGANAFISDVWAHLRAGISFGRFDAIALQHGCDARETLAALLDAGIVDVLRIEDRDVSVTSHMFLDFGLGTIRLSFSGDRTVATLRDMFAQNACDPRAFDEHLVIVDKDDHVEVVPVGGTPDRWHPQDIGAAVKAAVTEFVHQQANGVLLHTATLSNNTEALLIVGEPGAGKSTLSVALGVSGFDLEGDDIAVLLEDGRVRGVPFPATLKRGSVPMIAPLVPEIMDQPENLRLDNQHARYLPLNKTGVPPARRVRCLLLLQRDDTLKSGLQDLEPEHAIASLISGGWTDDGRMSPSEFNALALCVEGAAAYKLNYQDLDTGLALVQEAWASAALNGPAPVRQSE